MNFNKFVRVVMFINFVLDALVGIVKHDAYFVSLATIFLVMYLDSRNDSNMPL